MNELLEKVRERLFILIGDYKIEYNGIKIDTVKGKTESWTITKQLSFFEEGVDKE